MSKVTIAAVPVALGRFQVGIRDPGIVRVVVFEQRPTLVMTSGRPEFENVPVLFIEGAKDAPIRNHTFVAIRMGQWCETDDGEIAEWVGTGIGGKGEVVHVFEIKEAAS